MNEQTHSALLTQRQAAAYLGVSTRTMQRLSEAGVLRPTRIAGLGRARYRLEDVERFARGESP